MTRFCLPMILLLMSLSTRSQQLSQVMFSGGANLSYFSFITDQKIIIRISPEGNLLEWGTDPGTGRYNYYSGKLQTYPGRVEYFGQDQHDSLLRGKVKSIGTCMLTYYGSTEMGMKTGKLKTIGTVALDYFTNFENDALKGKLKSAGYTVFDYYPSSENEAYRGKVKTIGNSSITYYSSFDDKLTRGKVKSIGSFNYVWYTSHDAREYQGALKSGTQLQMVNGVTYIVR